VNQQDRVARRRRIIVTIAGGGFFWQSRSVAQGLGDDFELHYVTPEDPRVWAGRGLPPGEYHSLSRVTNQSDATVYRKATNLLSSLCEALSIVRSVRPHAIVCIASSVAVPLCVWGRVFRVKTVFVESITRVSRPSTTGRMLDILRLCDRIYVQWPEAVPLYRRAIYRGTVL
jgi:hypothetical protein